MASNKYALGKTIMNVLKSPTFWTAAPPVAAGVGAIGNTMIQEPRRKAKAYKNMLGANPTLQKRNGDKTRAYFNSMYNVSPALAKDPHVSGAWVQNVLDNEDPHDARPNYTLLSAVQDLAGPNKSIVDARFRSQESPVMGAAVRSMESIGKTLSADREFSRGRELAQQDAKKRLEERNAEKKEERDYRAAEKAEERKHQLLMRRMSGGN